MNTRAIGNPLQYRNGINLSWTRGRMLANYQSSSYNISYKYDYNGLRTSKSVYNSSNGTTLETKYYYDGKQLIKEKSGNDVLWFLYNYDGLLVGFELNGTTYYYEKNIQGDIIKIYDDTGKEEVEYTYDAWGKITSMSGNQTLGEKNPFRYRGYYYDKETGLYYLQSRYYDNEIKRYLNSDNFNILGVDRSSVSQDNLYTYCSNNPVNCSDPSGEFNFKWVLKHARSKKFVSTALDIAIGLVLDKGTSGIKTTISKKIKEYGEKRAQICFSQVLRNKLIAKYLGAKVANKLVSSSTIIWEFISVYLDPGLAIFNAIDKRDKKPNNGYWEFW